MQGDGVDSSGSSNKSSISTVSKAEVMVLDQDYAAMSEVSSFPTRNLVQEEEDGAELDLGLGLGLCFGAKAKPYCRILTAKDFPSSSPSLKRASDSSNRVVGWPPIRVYRKNSLVNQVRGHVEDRIDINKDDAMSMDERSSNSSSKKNREKGHGKSLFVKVNMDGVAIGRKVDLNAHVCYETLAQALDDLFHRPTTIGPHGFLEEDVIVEAREPSKLLEGSSEFVLTYEDREGDWMLVGDVPWGMFLSTVKRLRIMKTSEANGLAPRFQHERERQRNKPV